MSNPKILIVEDNRIYAENLKISLQANKFDVMAMVATGESAIHFLEQTLVDLILMDIKLQGNLSGIETAKKILTYFDIPIIYLTAFTDKKTVNQAKTTEPYGFLDKPSSDAELQRTIEFALYKHQMERKLRKSEEQFKQISASAHDGIVLINEKGLINFWNQAAEKIFGYSQDEAVDKKLYSLIAPANYLQEYKDIYDQFLSVATGTKEGKTIELVARTKSGELKTIELSLSCFKEVHDYNLVAIIRDISERKSAEQEHIRLSTALKQTGESILITDIAGNIEYVNPAFEKITGYKKEEVLGKNPRIFNSGKQTIAFYKKLWETISQGQVWKGRFVNKKKDGTLYQEEATISAVRDNFGKIVNYVAVKRDITAKLELEKKMRQNHNLQIMGLYANLFIHDFKNSLQPILTECENLLDTLPVDSDFYKKINSIRFFAKEAAEVARQILIFSRKETSSFTSVCVKTVIEDLFKVIDAIKPPDVKIVTDLETDCEPILANQTQIYQLLVNLCTNAFQAMQNSMGTLTLRLKQLSINSEIAQKFSSLNEGNYVRLSVSDTGHGIAKEDISKIFEPSFSTKVSADGFGLGLTSVRNIVKNHNGEITVDSEKNEGTTFHIFFPTTTKKVTTPHSLPQKIKGGMESILLVDDDESIAEMLKISLQRLGYTVMTFTSSLEALEKFKSAANKFDIIISDQTMPALPGDLLAMEIRKIRADIPIILSTGNSDKINKDLAAKLGIKEILLKPFTRQQLAQAIRSILDKNLS